LPGDATAVIGCWTWVKRAFTLPILTVRELENICRRLMVVAPGRTITSTDLPIEFIHTNEVVVSGNTWQQLLEKAVSRRLSTGENEMLAEFGPDFERVLLRTALNFTGGRKQDVARWIGWGQNTLTRKPKELKVDL
jgi:two-component system, NtrC family, nitrogen regulation response regulator GlnG